MLLPNMRHASGLFITLIALTICGPTKPVFGIQADNDGNQLLRVAPEECWLYSTWSNQSKPDANSANHTDRLLAEPEVSAFASDIIDRVGRILPMVFASAPESQRQQIAEVAPPITDALFRKSGCLFIERILVHDSEAPPEVEGALLLEIGDQAGMVANALAQLAGGEAGVKGVQIGGKQFATITLGPDPAAIVFVGSVDNYLMIGMGASSIERALQRMSGTATAKWLSELESRHALDRRSTLGFINIRAIRKAFLPFGGPQAGQIISATGLSNVESLESSSGYSETEMVNRVLLRLEGKPQGALALFGDNGIQPEELAHVPADSLFAMAVSLDPEKVFNFAQSLMLQFSPRDADEMMREMTRFQEKTGVDLRNDIINQIGPTWSLYNGASDGLFTGIALTASVDEPDRLAGALRKLVQLAIAESDGEYSGPKFSRRMAGEAEVFSMQIPDMPLPFEPSWCISGNRIIVAMFPQTITPVVKPMDYKSLIDPEAFDGFRKSYSTGDGNTKLLGLVYQDSQRQFEVLYPYLQMVLGMSRMFMTEFADMPPEAAQMMESLLGGISLPPARSIHKHLVPNVSVFRQTAIGFEAETRQTIPMVDVTFTVPVAIALLLPAVQQTRGAARRMQSMNNLKQMALAMHNHASAFERFPSGSGPLREGQPPVSWRVRILPYIEQQAMYDNYNFDEPWDSEHNLQFLEMMPEVYRSPSSTAAPGMTVYWGIGGKDGVLGSNQEGAHGGRSFSDLIDGTSNTIMFVETSDELAVPWTQPDEGFDPDQADFDSLFGMYPGGTNAAFCDGSVHFISDVMDRGILSQLMKYNDGGPQYGWDLDQSTAPDFSFGEVPREMELKMPEITRETLALENPGSLDMAEIIAARNTIDPDFSVGEVAREMDLKVSEGTIETLTLENFGSPEMAEIVAARKDTNRLANAVLAMHNWHDVYNGFPAAYSTDAEGKPQLSWRVHLLPYLEQQALYEQFHLDEPWDSEHNIGLLKIMPVCYLTGGSDPASGKTTLLAIGGVHGLISKPGDNQRWSQGFRLQDVTDGTSNTILVIDCGADLAVEWTRPDEFVPDAATIASLLKQENGFNAGFADGHIERMPASASPVILRQLFNRDDELPDSDWRDKLNR